MPRSELNVQFDLERIECHDEGDGWGDAEPYLWTVFFKVDGDTVSLGDDLFLHGTATVTTTPGSHGNLGNTDVGGGDTLIVPSAIGEHTTRLRPIPVPDWVRQLGVEDVGGVVGVATVLMEEDWVSDGGAEAGHAALNTFVQQAIDTLIPTLGVTNPDVDDEEIAALTAGAADRIADAIAAAQSGWDNFVSWLNADDQIGSKVWVFSHDRLASEGSVPFSQRWENEGDWELFGQVTATPLCPAETLLALLRGLGLADEAAERRINDMAREFRRRHFAASPQLGSWWHLAERNTAAITHVLRRHPELLRDRGKRATEALAAALGDPAAVIDPGLLEQAEQMLQGFVAHGSRRLRIDSKAALGALPALRGASLLEVKQRLCAHAPTRKPHRLPRGLAR